jgi:hypothetical protein
MYCAKISRGLIPFTSTAPEIANQRRDEILGAATRKRCRPPSPPAQGAKHAADNFRLPVEVHEPLFDKTCEFQVTIDFE